MLLCGNGLSNTFRNAYENNESINKKMEKLCYKKESLCNKLNKYYSNVPRSGNITC